MQTDLGAYVIQQETKVLCNLINNNFFKNILIVGEPKFSLIEDSLLAERHKSIYQFILHPRLSGDDKPSKQTPKSMMIAGRQDKIPIENDSIDMVILPHSLEMMANPHEILRESHRILRAEGKILITGFNDCSLWGLFRLIARIFVKAPWKNNFLAVTKLFDWLALLGFDDSTVTYYCYNLPISNQKILNKLVFLEFIGNFMPFPLGNIYTITACKRVIPLTPIFLKKWDNIHLNDELAKYTLKS